MRITLLSIFALLCLLATCVCPCLVDSASGQEPDQMLPSFTFQVEQVELETHSGGAKPDGAVDLYDRAAGSGRNQTIYYFAKSTEGKKGMNAVNVKVVMTGPGGPLVQHVTIRPEGLGRTAAMGTEGVVRPVAGDDTDGDLKQGNDKIVRKKPGRTTYANITLSSYDDGSDLSSWDNGVEKGMIDLATGSSVTLYDMDGEVAAATAIEYGLIAALLGGPTTTALSGDDFRNSFWHCGDGPPIAPGEHFEDPLTAFEDPLTAVSDRTAIEYALIAALLRSSGSEGDLHVWHDGNQTTMMNLETGSAVVVEQHEIRDPGR